MRELSLFTGVGGGLLGTKLLGWTCVCAVEIEPYCQEVLVRRQADGWLDPFPIWPDVRTFDGTAWRGRVDVVTAGFPCQPFSLAGKRKGADDERNGWPDTARILGEVRPRYALLENVPGLLRSGYFGTVIGDLAAIGYDARWDVFSASECGAPHRRERLWIRAADASSDAWKLQSSQRKGLRDKPSKHGATGHFAELAHPDPNSGRRDRLEELDCAALQDPADRNPRGRHADGLRDEVSDSEGAGLDRLRSTVRVPSEHAELGGGRWWQAEPAVGRVVDGLSYRVDRLRGLGNAQVPVVVARAWRALS